MKELLFALFGYIGVIAVILGLIVLVLNLANKIFGIVKYIIMYRQYCKNKDLYDIKDNVIIGKDGRVRYSCFGTIDEKIDVLNKALNHLEDLRNFQEEHEV
ncbi:hypothetical protein [Lachnoclostridium sp.]|uniref:hypothetical protein n=1 Tax=Lachnoclostridium sp. TaxID=2028282 RepID=UPI002897C13A|nr:hypothetical protein [Lachnoclostridium sp.]